MSTNATRSSSANEPNGSPVALVVGAGDFIGAAIAKRFAAGGFVTAVGRRNADKLAPLVAEIEANGGRARGFAPTKAAQRILAESMARSLGPRGVHVAYVVIDAVIDVPWTRERFAGKPDEFFAKPDDIAETIWHLAHQPRSAWSFEVDLRPFGENW